jgi:hypothetical protein
MSEKSMLTKEAFHGLCARYGFTQAGKGSQAALDAGLQALTTKLTIQAIHQAEHDRQSGLNERHAQKAIDMTPEVPKGYY